MAGRKPKPTALKKLEGNPGKRKLNTKEPIPAKGMLNCPEWLLPEAKKEWERLADLMNQMGVLTEVDMAAFAAYCQSYARWKEAQEHIDSGGSTFETDKGYQQQTPWVGIANTNQKLMLQAASEFGGKHGFSVSGLVFDEIHTQPNRQLYDVLTKYTLDPWVSRWEQAMVRALLSAEEKKKYFFKFNVDGLLRGDYQSRMTGYATARQNGWMSANDIRELENMDRIPEELGGDLYLINGNMTKLQDAGIFAGSGKGKDTGEEVLELEENENGESGNRTGSG